MVEIGQLLRQTREAKELSLADVEEQTRIRQRYLNALESGDWDELPNPVAARGFLRTYATFLGLDADELVAQSLNDSENGGVVASSAASASEYKPINLDLYEETTRRSHFLRRILGFILVLIPVIILAYLLYQYGLPYLQGRMEGGETNTATVELPPEGQAPGAPVIGPTASATATATVAATPTTRPVLTVEGTLPTFTPTPDATVPPTITPSPTLTATPAEAIRLRVVVTNTAWIRVVTDGTVQIESLADPGYDQEFVAYKQLEFLTGNAGGVKLTLDGEQLPPLGEIGEIATFIWAIEDGQVIELTPTPTPSPSATPTPKPGLTPTQTPETGG